MGDPLTKGIREEGLEEMAGRHNLQPVGGFPLRIARAGLRGRDEVRIYANKRG